MGRGQNRSFHCRKQHYFYKNYSISHNTQPQKKLDGGGKFLECLILFQSQKNFKKEEVFLLVPF